MRSVKRVLNCTLVFLLTVFVRVTRVTLVLSSSFVLLISFDTLHNLCGLQCALVYHTARTSGF